MKICTHLGNTPNTCVKKSKNTKQSGKQREGSFVTSKNRHPTGCLFYILCQERCVPLLLLNHDFCAVDDVDTLLGGLSGEATTAEVIPHI